VLIAYDRDEAGDRAAEKLSRQLMAEGLDCYRIQFPKGMDANEYALKVTPAAKSLGLVIRKAQWLGKGPPPRNHRGSRSSMVETRRALPASGREHASTASASNAKVPNRSPSPAPSASPTP
jgi:DNA primase